MLELIGVYFVAQAVGTVVAFIMKGLWALRHLITIYIGWLFLQSGHIVLGPFLIVLAVLLFLRVHTEFYSYAGEWLGNRLEQKKDPVEKTSSDVS